MKARDVALWAKIIGVVVLIIGVTLKGLGIFTIEVGDLVLVAFSVPLLFADVSINLIAEKIFGKPVA